MNLVRQHNSKGCGIACVAMVTGLPYQECKLALFGSLGKVTGMFHDDVVKFITERGFVAGKRKYTREIEGAIKPEAALNLLEVRVYPDSEGSHFVIMDREGNVLDPMFGQTELSFYHEVWSIIGFERATNL